MTCIQHELDDARAEGVSVGVSRALKIVQDEFDRAQEEVNHTNKKTSTFAAANRDRAILRRDVLKKIRDEILKL
jgi:hypothetical protein